MAKKIWESEAVSIIVLPSVNQGREILELAQEWSRSWLLTPALWMLADEIPEFSGDRNIDLQVPPQLKAYLLGRDGEQNSVREEVDVFWTLGSQPFKTIRFIAVRTEQDQESMARTTSGAETAAKFIEQSVPFAINKRSGDNKLNPFKKYNLVIAPTNERKVVLGVLGEFWDVNLIAAAEDRSTPLSTDSFVKVGERFIGFALAHIATTGGLWSGLPTSSAEINHETVQTGVARLQRVFVRGVTSDALSADVAEWAMQKLNFADTNFDVGGVEGTEVRTIAADYQDFYMNELVDFILAGPESAEETDNFLYDPFESARFAPIKEGIFKKFLTRLADMASGLGALPKWTSASAQYRLNFALDDEALQQVEEFHLPAAERGVGADELVECRADFIREALEQLNAQDVADELNKARLAVFVDLAQQVFGDMRVFFVQQFSELVGLVCADGFAVLNLLQHRVVLGEFGNQTLDHFAVAGDADRLVLRAELGV